jgi:hypothetical protein
MSTSESAENATSEPEQPVHTDSAEGPLPLRGLLRDYFKDREDIAAFLTEERSGWDERDRLLEAGRQAIWERFRQRHEES